MRAALSLGSNLGPRRLHLLWARRQLQTRLKVEAFSRMLETTAVGPAGSRSFLNAAAVVRGDLEPAELLAFARELEDALGRDALDRAGPRALDIDILLIDQETIDEPGLSVPHPRLAERRFVLEPLAEVAGDWLVPGSLCSVEVLLEDLS